MTAELFNLLKKYDVAGPRYTSYPTVPAWVESVTEQNYRDHLKLLKHGENLSLYFHIPFCEALCHYCGCMKVITKDHSKSREYVDVLLAEVDRVADLIPSDARDVSQLHFGGGTPNYLQPSELQEVMERVHKHFRFLPQAEVAIEMHPKTSTKEFCEMLAKLGFNRISLGVQDLDPKVQKLINRHQSYEMTADMLSLLRQLSFKAFNFDLIYGLPGQSTEGWQKTLEQVLFMNPDRLAVYSYAHVPWLKSYQRSFEDKDLPGPERKIQLFQQAYEFFTKNGYRLIGMDHFARADDALSKALDNGTIHRNFMGYSTQADAHQIGFGVSSISFVGGGYFQNQKDLQPYYEVVRDKKILATYRGYLLENDDRIRRGTILRIMCLGKIVIPEWEKEWGVDFHEYFKDELPALQTFIEDGLLEQSRTELKVVGIGFLFLRNMAMVFDRYLRGIREHATTPVFSRTV